MKFPKFTPAEERKFIAALVTFGTIALDQGLLHGSLAHWTTVAIAFLGAVVVRQVPNDPKQAEGE